MGLVCFGGQDFRQHGGEKKIVSSVLFVDSAVFALSGSEDTKKENLDIPSVSFFLGKHFSLLTCRAVSLARRGFSRGARPELLALAGAHGLRGVWGCSGQVAGLRRQGLGLILEE